MQATSPAITDTSPIGGEQEVDSKRRTDLLALSNSFIGKKKLARTHLKICFCQIMPISMKPHGTICGVCRASSIRCQTHIVGFQNHSIGFTDRLHTVLLIPVTIDLQVSGLEAEARNRAFWTMRAFSQATQLLDIYVLCSVKGYSESSIVLTTQRMFSSFLLYSMFTPI